MRLKGASGESEGLRRYDKENLLWQSTVANLLWQSGLTLLALEVLDGTFSIAPHIALAGGSERWNRRRYGNYPDAQPLSQGLNTVDYGVRVRLPLRLGTSVYVGFCGYHAYDGDTRAQIRASRRRGTTRRTDAFFLTSGFSWEF